MPASAEPSNSRPNIPDYNQIFAQPLLPPDPQSIHHKRNFLYRHRNSFWWLVIFAIFLTSVAILYTSDLDMIDPGCG